MAVNYRAVKESYHYNSGGEHQTFAPSGRSMPMSWDRVRSHPSSTFQYDSHSNVQHTMSGRVLLSDRHPTTLGG